MKHQAARPAESALGFPSLNVVRPRAAGSGRPMLPCTATASREAVRRITCSRTIGTVLDERLVGYWSDKNLYPGDMEAADIAFRADGTGWAYWYSAATTFEILRFSWQSTATHQVTLNLLEELSGTWNLDRGTITHRTNSQIPCQEQVSLAYQITAGHDAASKAATLLEFDEPVVQGVIGNRFALERQLGDNEDDPAHGPWIPSSIT
jgi:hypothetical protein